MKNYPPSNNFYVKNMGVLSGREMRLKINIDTEKPKPNDGIMFVKMLIIYYN